MIDKLPLQIVRLAIYKLLYLKKEINKPWFKNGMNELGKELDLPVGMNWEEFWMKWFLSEDPSAYIKVDGSE